MATPSPLAPTDNFDNDPFKHTSMTFGEHLDELRSALFKAGLALAIGFLIGLYFGESVVRHIQDPMVDALKEYYQQQSTLHFKQELQYRAENGDVWAKEMLTKSDKELGKFINEDGMLFNDYYVAPQQIFAELQRHFPEQFDKSKLPELSPDEAVRKRNMIRVQLWHPIDEDERLRLTSFSGQEPFMIWVKAALVTGAVLASPFIFYFLWSFVAAGLYPHEKHYIHIFLPFSVGLFLLGAAMAFFLVFPPVLNFFLGFNTSLDIDPKPRISEWLNFVLLMPLCFGISFQLPLVMLFLERIGIFNVEAYLSKWRIAVLVIAFLSMVLSPGGDPNSMLLMFIPLVGLYFVGIGLCRWMPSPRNELA